MRPSLITSPRDPVLASYSGFFAGVADREAATGWTIERFGGLADLADRGTPFQEALANPDLARLADGRRWTAPMRPSVWTPPAGAFGHGGGPS